jgi:hypothetical protein
MAQAKQQATLGGLWEEAAGRYKADLKRFDDEYEKKHSHVWNIHRHKKPSADIPTMYSAKDFTAELERKKAGFRDMRMKGHAVFKAMNSLATPVEIIGGQASAIGSMVSRLKLIAMDGWMDANGYAVHASHADDFRRGDVSVQCRLHRF